MKIEIDERSLISQQRQIEIIVADTKKLVAVSFAYLAISCLICIGSGRKFMILCYRTNSF